MTKSASLTSSADNRSTMPYIRSVWEHKTTFVWQTNDGNAAQAVTLNLNGKIKSAVISVSEVTANPTVNVVLTDANSASLLALSTLADGTVHYKDSGDFDEIPIAGNLTITVTPSADAGGSGQTLTVIVILRGY